MKTLVVYYSRTGNTRNLALGIAEKLNASIDEIKDEKNRKGWWNWIMAGYDAKRENHTEINFARDPKEFDLVIIGGPNWAGRIAPAVRTYLDNNKFDRVGFFVSSGGDKYKGCYVDMTNLCLNVQIKAKMGLSEKEKSQMNDKIEEFCKSLV